MSTAFPKPANTDSLHLSGSLTAEVEIPCGSDLMPRRDGEVLLRSFRLCGADDAC